MRWMRRLSSRCSMSSVSMMSAGAVWSMSMLRIGRSWGSSASGGCLAQGGGDRGQGACAAGDLADRLEELEGGHALVDDAVRTGDDRGHEHRGVGVRGVEHDGRGGDRGLEAGGRASGRPRRRGSSRAGRHRARSGRARGWSSAAADAVPTGTRPGSERSAVWRPSRTAWWSSTTATRIMGWLRSVSEGRSRRISVPVGLDTRRS